MKRYYVTSPSFGGFVEYIYNASGILVMFNSSEATLTEEQILWFATNLPAHLADLERLIPATPKLKLQQITTEVTFEMMWNRYDDKLSSSKKRAQIKWERMSRADRVKAYYYVPTYVGSLGAGIRKKYLETYLNSELWNN